MALSGRLRSDDDVDPARRQDGNGHAFDRGSDRAFDVIGNPDAGELAASLCAALSGLEAAPVRVDQCLFHVAAKVSGVVGQSHGAAKRHVGAADDVASADLGAVHRQFARGEIKHSLDEVICFRPSGAAIGRCRRCVGHDGMDAAMRCRNSVDGRQHPHGIRGRDIGDGLRADGGIELDAQSQGLAAPIERQCHVGEIIASLIVGQERFRSRARPSHRPRSGAGLPRARQPVPGRHRFADRTHRRHPGRRPAACSCRPRRAGAIDICSLVTP